MPLACVVVPMLIGVTLIRWRRFWQHRFARFVGRSLRRGGSLFVAHGVWLYFYGDSPHPDKAWREDDFCNPLPTYSRTKWAADLVLSTLPNVGIARIRMPIDSIPSAGNLIDKIASFPKVIDVENSATIVEDMISVFYQLMEKKRQAFFHVTNPGTIRHRQVVELYQQMVDPNYTCEWIHNDDLVKLGLVSKGRSNNFWLRRVWLSLVSLCVRRLTLFATP